MNKQQSIADIEYENRKRKTKRDAFLEMMEEVIPWEEWTAVVEPYYPSGKRGRPPRGMETMLRMYLLANWFSLSDEGVEDAIYDSYAFRKFMRIDFLGEEQVPDATTLCKFRALLNESGITKLLFDTMRAFLDRHGKLMHGGSIVDATIIEVPTSTKNAELWLGAKAGCFPILRRALKPAQSVIPCLKKKQALHARLLMLIAGLSNAVWRLADNFLKLLREIIYRPKPTSVCDFVYVQIGGH